MTRALAIRSPMILLSNAWVRCRKCKVIHNYVCHNGIALELHYIAWWTKTMLILEAWVFYFNSCYIWPSFHPDYCLRFMNSVFIFISARSYNFITPLNCNFWDTDCSHKINFSQTTLFPSRKLIIEKFCMLRDTQFVEQLFKQIYTMSIQGTAWHRLTHLSWIELPTYFNLTSPYPV